jgi:hypothetical protein
MCENSIALFLQQIRRGVREAATRVPGGRSAGPVVLAGVESTTVRQLAVICNTVSQQQTLAPYPRRPQCLAFAEGAFPNRGQGPGRLRS